MNTAPKQTESTGLFTLEHYRAGDEGEILTLFEEVFGTPKSREHWEWQFQKNPYSVPRAVLAWDTATRKLVGQHTVMPSPLNLMGRRIKAGQSVDAMVHPHFRMHGIFEDSAKECFQWMETDGFSVVFAFPNRNSYPGFMRKLGWSRVAYLTSYFTWLGLPPRVRRPLPFLVRWLADLAAVALRLPTLWLRRAALSMLVRGYRFRSARSVPDGYDELWGAVRSYEVLSLWKDAAYFKWRYDQRPGGEYTYHYLERDGRIDALCVSVANEDAWEVLELIVRHHSVRNARYLMASVELRAALAGASKLNFCGSALDFFNEVFRGYHRAIEFSRALCVRVLRNEVRETDALMQSNWTITYGDSDTL